jgi:type I restriction enzyme M protein
MSKIDDETISKEVEKEIQNLKNELLLSTNRDEVKTRIDKLSKSCIFGTDANPRMARVSKMNMIMHGDGHGGVHHNDGLLNINGIFEERFDMIVTNPPFGTRVDKELKIEKSDRYNDDIKIAKYKAKYGERYEKVLDDMDNYIEENKSITSLYNTSEYSTLTETLFMERCINLLKKGGRMGIVLPEGVLNSSNLEKVREYFESRAKILLIVSLPQEIFISSGATVKTSLLFLKRFTNTEEIEYNKIKEETTKEINSKYKSKENEIKAPLLSKAKELEQLKDAISKIKEAKKDSKVDNKGINTLLGGLAGLAVSENIGGGIIGAIAGVSLTAMKENDDKKKIEVQLKELQSKEKDIKKDIKPLQKEEKSLLQELEAKKTQEIKELIKERFDYEIPIADIQQAGISATGTKIENELPQLLKEFKKYRKSNKLWGDSISTIGQLLEEI